MQKTLVRILGLSLFLCCSLNVFAQVKRPAEGDEDWRLLIKAQNCFTQGDYGSALSYAEKAKQSRRQLIDWEVYTLENTLKNSRVRKANDKLELVLPELQTYSTAASEIAQSYVALHGIDFFNNSFSNLVSYVDSLRVYPEADCLVGKVYELDGETALAIQYLTDAYRNADKLDVSDERYDILYHLAMLSYNTGDDEAYETYLLLILKDDQQYTNASYLNALVRTISNDQVGTMEKFFKLYRSNRDISLKSLASLAEYYASLGQAEKSLRASALGSVIAFTMMYETLQSRLTAWEYTDLSSMIKDASMYADIVQWGNENNVWKLFCEFGDAVLQSGCLIFSNELFTALSQSIPEEYWRKRAEQRLVR